MTELKRVLGFPAILLITINSIMGTGIYFLPAAGAKYAGPASILSWIIMSVIAIYIGMCFAELVSMFPKAGGVYEYCKQTYGRFISFLIGWLLLIAGNITISMLIVGAIQYLLPYPLPLVKTALSIFFILVFNFIAYKGMKTSAFMLVSFAVMTIGILLALIIPGLFSLEPSNFQPFFVFGGSSIFITLFFIAETFFGWESAAFLAEETKNPEKVMPKAMIYGTIVIAIMAITLSVVALGNIKWKIFGGSGAPLADLGGAIFGATGQDLFSLGIYIAIISAVACWVVSSPRLILALARDKLFLSQFAKIHPKYNTPHRAIFLQTIITITLILIVGGAYRMLLLLLIPLAIVIYSFTLVSLVSLRYKKPHLKRHFKVPFGKVGPILVILFNIFLIVMWATHEEGAIDSLKFGGSLVLVGIPIYFLLEMYYNPKSIRIVQDTLAYLTLITEGIGLPVKRRKEIIALLGKIKGKTVLEYGCSVGTLTMHLAKEVGKGGRVYATDSSKREVDIAQKRLDKKGHKHVKVLHDEDHHKRIHPHVPKLDTAVSVGMMGYVQDMGAVLSDVNKRLKKGAKICFVDYDKFFDIIPNKEWLGDDKKIKRMFHNAGFTVGVLRKQGFAWKYVIIYGVKFKNV
jgi:amino acid transporter/precorrin-6B methylase 2